MQRWLGLATVEVQTASAGGEAELKIEGVIEYEALRDALYRRMRGARDDDGDEIGAVDGTDEALGLLREIRDALARSGDGRGKIEDGDTAGGGDV